MNVSHIELTWTAREEELRRTTRYDHHRVAAREAKRAPATAPTPLATGSPAATGVCCC